MKGTIILFVLLISAAGLRAQDTREQIIEKRARELHRIISLSDRVQWTKFIKENYTQAFIDKPMKTQMSRDGDGGGTTEKKEINGNLDGKADMLQRLHNDFGSSKIVAIKPKGDQLEMELSGGDVTAVFTLKFAATAPYLIDGVGVRAEGGPR